MVAYCMPATGDLAPNLGMCPNWELNWQPFGSQASTQSTEPQQPKLIFCFFKKIKILSVNYISIELEKVTDLKSVNKFPLSYL